MDKKTKTFVPFAIPNNGGDSMADQVINYLDTWLGGEYFGWDYATKCPTTADIWHNIAKFEATHHSDDSHILGFVVFCGWEEDPYGDVIWLGYFDENNCLVIDHDKAYEAYICNE